MHMYCVALAALKNAGVCKKLWGGGHVPPVPPHFLRLCMVLVKYMTLTIATCCSYFKAYLYAISTVTVYVDIFVGSTFCRLAPKNGKRAGF